MVRLFTLSLLLHVVCLSTLFGSIEYEVDFEGVTETKTLELLQSACETVKLRERPPSTACYLKKRAEADIQNIIQVYHSLAHYHPKVDLIIDDSLEPIHVGYFIEEGPVYPLAACEFIPVDVDDPYPYDCIPLSDLGITLGCPAYPTDILHAEELYLELMGRSGFPLAEIVKREVLVDQTTKKVSVLFHVKSGPECFFGPVVITGNQLVCEAYIRKKIQWHPGLRYDHNLVECTVNVLETTGLFSTITVCSSPELLDNGSLPMRIEVKEGCHRSIGYGLSYDTQRGIGAGGEWENRNFRGMGEKLSTSLFVWQKRVLGSALYVQPDFCRKCQDLLLLMEYEKEETKAFEEKAFSVSATIERQLTPSIRYSYGTMFKQLRNTNTDNDGDFNLFKLPMQFLWTATDDPLNPCYGGILQLKAIPTIQVLDHMFGYGITTLSGSVYHPIYPGCRTILAGKFLLGSIIGAGRKTIPGSERFYAGSENTLRGYRFFTVSPLDEKNDPIGGRSILVYSAELRLRTSEDFGIVGFYDIGNVYEESFPTFDRKLLQSVGVGLRYFTAVAPLRLDVAFPLNPRKGLDSNYQFYLSVGQAF